MGRVGLGLLLSWSRNMRDLGTNVVRKVALVGYLCWVGYAPTWGDEELPAGGIRITLISPGVQLTTGY